jgi:hypothetical protein
MLAQSVRQHIGNGLCQISHGIQVASLDALARLIAPLTAALGD